METIFEKYERLRPAMCDGDLIAFHGTKPLARIIQSSDKNSDGSWARHNHIGVIVEKHGALYIEDSNGKGVQADRLSWRVKHDYPNGDFTIIKPLVSKELIDAEMHRLLKRSDDKWIKYDFENGAKELANRRWGWNLKVHLDDDRDICSDYASRYVINLDIVNNVFKSKTIVFPEDYFRYLILERAKVLN